MDIAAIDYWAHSGQSFLHRASAGAKLLMTGLLIAALIVANRAGVAAGLYAGLVLVVWRARLPLGTALMLSTYPLVFSVLFVASQWEGGWERPALLLLKTMGAALAALLLIGTTPYPEIFGALQRVLPHPVADGLYLTYRSLFILARQLERLVTAFRLRGGWAEGPLRRRLENLANALGLLLVQAFDQSQRQYAVMNVRGYQGKLAAPRRLFASPALDAPPLLLGAAALALALAAGG